MLKIPTEFEKVEKLVLQRGEFHRNLRHSRLHSTQMLSTTSSNSTLSKKQEQNYHQSMPLSSLNNFLKTCGVQETAIPTASVTIQDDISVREQTSFYMANVKNIPHFETFWTRYGTQLPDLVSVLKCYSCMQCSSVPCESSFSISGYIDRKQRCSLSASTIRYSMCLKNQYDEGLKK